MKEELGTFENPKGKVFVSIYPSNLKDKDGNQIGGYIGKIKKRTRTVEQLIAKAKDRGSTLSPQTLFYAAQVLSNAAKEALADGYAVDLLGLGTLGFAIDGSLDSSMSSREISEHFKLQFTPSKSAENLLKNISPSNIYVHNSKISITEVKSFSAGQTDMNVVYQGRPLCIKGNGLKLGGDVCGVFLVPLTEQYVYAPRSEWINLPNPYTNTPKKLELFFPESLNISYDAEKGEEEPLFCIAVVTSLTQNGRKRAECIEEFSMPFYVRKVE